VLVHFYALEFPGQELNRMAGFQQLAELSHAFKAATVLNPESPPQRFYSRRTGSVMVCLANSAVQLSPPDGRKQLRIGFGVLSPEETSAEASGPVEFRLSKKDDQGNFIALWSQTLDPRKGAAEMDRQHAMIDLSQCQSQMLVLQTISSDPMQRPARAYWAELEFIEFSQITVP
jgi:hypothetical protein